MSKIDWNAVSSVATAASFIVTAGALGFSIWSHHKSEEARRVSERRSTLDELEKHIEIVKQNYSTNVKDGLKRLVTDREYRVDDIEKVFGYVFGHLEKLKRIGDETFDELRKIENEQKKPVKAKTKV